MGENRTSYIPVKNRMGTAIVDEHDSFVQHMIFAAGRPDAAVLEIGAAFGDVSRSLAARGAVCTVNDLDARNLAGVHDGLDEATRARLRVQIGRFPDELTLADSSFDAILVARVLHFLGGEEIELAARTLFRWLRPGGFVVATAETPFRGNLREFAPLYEARLARQDPWPGIIEDTDVYFTSAANLPRRMNLLDRETIARPFRQCGFEIERCEFFERGGLPPAIKLDGREGVGVIARRR